MTTAVSPARAFAVGAFGIATFSCMDAVMKGLVIAIGIYDTMFWRSVIAAGFTAALWLALCRRRPTRAALRLHLVRGTVSTVMALLFFWGLARVPMAQALALSYVAPLLALALAAVLLKERVPRAAIGASLIAFAGVGVILIGQARADLGHDAFVGAIAILVSAFCYAWNIILMRQQSLAADPIEIIFFQSVVVAVLLALAAPWLASPISVEHAPALVLAAFLATASLGILAWAYAHAPASYLAPTEYTSFLWAAFFGYTIFGEIVSVWTIAGAALIVGGCVAAARRKPEPFAQAETMVP
ncbi:S-adenosylmethionine uptake transporter [Hephaestia caeni]|uniref:S-adenosylmethionine uptake transporter n=1 Tax=Hephaestia caeni TaxID=645617 RepID=A0A397P528_9SPHN|nr:DMT family transporter [Hephaestia caeni]RIA44656.1 S-adenosylmethionine uptake transporter [Hephaestia caeni]